MTSSADTSAFVIEETVEGRDLVVTGDWSPEAADVLRSGFADGLVLNYARGYRERSLDFLEEGWPVRRLSILARTIRDLSPVYGFANTLEALSVETSPSAALDLRMLPRLTRLGGDWEQVQDTIRGAMRLGRLFLMRYGEPDLRALGEHPFLTALVMKERPQLESLNGVDQLPALSEMSLFGAVRLRDISDLEGAVAVPDLRTLQLQSCHGIERLDAIGAVYLDFLNVSECGDIQSLSPLEALQNLRVLYLYGSTRILDGDLTPLTRLPRLAELRMQNRRAYRPSVHEIQKQLAGQGG